MIQIILKEGYQFNQHEFLTFIKTLRSYKRKIDKSSSLFQRVVDKLKLDFSFRYIIDCDKDGMVTFYFEDCTNNEDRLTEALKRLFQSDADVIPVNALEDYKYAQTLYFEPRTLDYQSADDSQSSLKSFDDSILWYIMAVMTKSTRVVLEFDVQRLQRKDLRKGKRFVETDHSELECCLFVKCKTKYQLKELTQLSETIRQITEGTGWFNVKYKEVFKPFKVSTEKIMNILSFPSIHSDIDSKLLSRIYYLRRNQTTLVEGVLDSGLMIGTVDHPLQKDRAVRLLAETISKHLFISGSSGSGKSSLLEQLIEDILIQQLEGKSNYGFTFFDPAETTVLGVLNKIKQLEYEGYNIDELIKKVHYIDFSYDELVFPMNLLDKSVNRERHMDFLKDIFGESKTPRLDRYLINSISALMDDQVEHVISDVSKLLLDDAYRSKVASSFIGSNDSFDEKTYDFIMKELPKTGAKNEIDPVLNRLDVFSNSKLKRRMFESGHSALNDIGKWFEEGHIVLFNLSGMSNQNMKLIAGYILVQYYNSAIKRKPYSNLHLVLKDEDHKLQLSISNNFRAELRKFGIADISATQYLDQYDQEYLNDVLANTMTKISMRQSSDGARKLSNVTQVNAKEYTSLQDNHGYVFTETPEGIKSLSFKVKPPFRYMNGKLIEKSNEETFKKQTGMVTDIDRKFARELMARDFYKASDIDKIIAEKGKKKRAEEFDIFG